MQIAVVARGLLVLLLSGCVTSFIIPEELPTILSLIYSNIPPVKKGTDSRVGVGFRLGEHADAQILVELGPQRETEPIGNTASKRRRQAMLDAAMNGDLGPWAQSVAKYQTQLRLQKEIEEQSRLREKVKKFQTKEFDQIDKTSGGSEWLTKWSKGMIEPPDQLPADEILPIQEILPNMAKERVYVSGIASGQKGMNEKMNELQKLFKPQPIARNV